MGKGWKNLFDGGDNTAVKSFTNKNKCYLTDINSDINSIFNSIVTPFLEENMTYVPNINKAIYCSCLFSFFPPLFIPPPCSSKS